MATVTGLTAERMQEIIDATIVDANVVGDDLILTLHDTTEVNAGNVRGLTGAIGPQAEPGDMMTSIRTSKTGWLLMGTSVAGADVAHPALWAIVPATWKSGTTLNLPSMSDRILQGGGTLGALTGANTKTLVEANLPPHVHAMALHNHAMGAHTHTMNHDHAAFNTGGDGGHSHSGFFESDLSNVTGTRTRLLPSGNPVGGTITNTVADHTHTVNVPSYSGSTGAATAANTANNAASNTGSGNGTSTPVNVEQAALRVNVFIKT